MQFEYVSKIIQKFASSSSQYQSALVQGSPKSASKKGKFLNRYKHIFILFFFTTFFSSCHNRHLETDPPYVSVVQENQKWMTKFFHDLLFSEGAVYTLWGSKPMTEIILYHYSDEEWAAIHKNIPPEDLKDGFAFDVYDLPTNWELWEKISSKFPMNRYLLFKSHTSEDGRISFIYFVDIFKTATVLQDHYALFKAAVGFDFHPLEAVLEMPNRDSKFWTQVRNADNVTILLGLLFGYGKTNAYTYHWKYFDSPELCQKRLDKLESHTSQPTPKGVHMISPSDFAIPGFISFTQDDEIVEQYQKDKEKIHKIYKKKDLLEVTLKRLIRP